MSFLSLCLRKKALCHHSEQQGNVLTPSNSITPLTPEYNSFNSLEYMFLSLCRQKILRAQCSMNTGAQLVV